MTEILQGDVKVPVLGKTRKVWVYGSLGVAGAYVGYRWWQASRAADEPTGPVADYEIAGVGDGVGVVAGGSDGTAGSGNNNQQTDGRSTDTIDNNAEWTAKAVEDLSNSGFNPATVRLALGEFLARRSLDASEASIARAALGAAGQPPIGGPYSVIEATAPTSLGRVANLRRWKAPTTSVISMQWEPVEGASHYRIFREGQGLEPVGDSLDTKFEARGLQPKTKYGFTVRAMSTLGKLGEPSNVYSETTAQVALTRPTGLKATAVGKTDVTMVCSKVAGATYYRWYVNGTPRGASDGPGPYRIGSLRPNTAYKITVAADTTNQSPGPVSAPYSVKTKR